MPHSNDKLIWVLLAVQAGLAYALLRSTLTHLLAETEVTHKENIPQGIGQDAEDAIKLDTLKQLSESPNLEIRKSACEIIADRTARGDAKLYLLMDLSGENPIERDKALTALNYLLDRPSTASYFRDEATYVSLISCLVRLLKEHNDPAYMFVSPIVPRTRPASERTAIRTMSRLVAYNANLAIEQKIVERWVARYPFPFLRRDDCRRNETFQILRAYAVDDPDMVDIVSTIASFSKGRGDLLRYGLCSPEDCNAIDADTWMVGGESTAGIPPPDLTQQPEDDGGTMLSRDGTVTIAHANRRPHDESAEAAAARRRRREAMVLSDGDRPIGRENIFQRQSTMDRLESGQRRETDNDIELEMERLREEVDQEDEEAMTEAEDDEDEDEEDEEEEEDDMDEHDAPVSEANVVHMLRRLGQGNRERPRSGVMVLDPDTGNRRFVVDEDDRRPREAQHVDDHPPEGWWGHIWSRLAR